MIYFSEKQLRVKYTNLLQITDYDYGHFAALEVPELLTEDVYAAVDKFVQFNKEAILYSVYFFSLFYVITYGKFNFLYLQ